MWADMSDYRVGLDSEIRSLKVIGRWTAAMLVGALLALGLWAPIDGAVISVGRIISDSKIKLIQHPTGGVVNEILVKNGDMVKAGTVLVRMDESIVRAEYNLISGRLRQARIRLARLQAESRELDKIAFPDDILNSFSATEEDNIVANEIALFESRRSSNAGLKKQLEERIEQAGQMLNGLSAQLNAKAKEIELLEKEHSDISGLFEKRLVSQARYLSLERAVAVGRGEKEKIATEIARMKSSIIELNAKITQSNQEFKAQVEDSLRATLGEMYDLEEKRAASEVALSRIEVRSPVNGYVHDIAIHTVGGVVQGGARLMSIVPSDDPLTIEAKVSPTDIDQVKIDANVLIHVRSGNQRLREMYEGNVLVVSQDLVYDDKMETSYYTVRATVKFDAAEGVKPFKLMPGMPVDVFIKTEERSILEYLFAPVIEQIRYAWRER
jgi:HlyD family secretion protein